MTSVGLVTPAGRRFTATYQHDMRYGWTIYRTPNGAFTLAPTLDEEPRAVHIAYGIDNPSKSFGYEDRPEAPVFFGITLHGTAVIRPDATDPDWGPRWINARRLRDGFRSECVPDTTRRRVAEMAHALAAHWLDLPEWPDVLHACLVARAPRRYAEHRHLIHNLRNQLAETQQRLADEMTKADQQAKLLPDGFDFDRFDFSQYDR